MTIQKPDFNQIFASQAPAVDKPPVFNNYNGGWGNESRPNNGKPTIKGFNYLQQLTDTKLLWLKQNAILPYDSDTDYPIGNVTLKDGKFQKWDGSSWIDFIKLDDSQITTWSGRTQEDKNRETLSILDFGGVEGETCPRLSSKFATLAEAKSAYPTIADKITTLDLYVNDVAALHSESLGIPLKIPAGTWRFSSPFNIGDKTYLYGRGAKAIFDKAEWRRRGGSTGTLRPAEQYTLYFQSTSNLDSDIHVFVNTAEVAWSWFSENVISVPAVVGTTTTDTITYYITNGYHLLGEVPENLNGYTMDLAGGSVMQTEYQASNVAGGVAYNNFRAGSRAGMNLTTGGSNTYVGARAGCSNKIGGNNVAMGYQALYRSQGNNNIALGAITMEWHVSGDNNLSIGVGALGGNTNGNRNISIGNGSNASATGDNSIVIGYEAHNRIGYNQTLSGAFAIGMYAGNYHRGTGNMFMGYAAGRSFVDETNDGSLNIGSDNLFVGNFSGTKITNGQRNIAFGNNSLATNQSGTGAIAIGYNALNLSTVSENTAVGNEALKSATTTTRSVAVGAGTLGSVTTANESTAVGWRALELLTTGNENTAIGIWAGQNATATTASVLIGSRSGQSLTTGSFNTLVGRRAGGNLTTGGTNTFIGGNAGRLLQDGTDNTISENASSLGNDARVSGSNQVQLGNSATTTYVYGTVQNRSDLRDKADIRDTALGLDFICSLRPVDYKWDMREDYIETLEDGTVIKHEKDGSKKRNRYHHGFIAQEVKALADQLGVDFGGYQDHTLQGGTDVLSIGYDEFIAPTIKAIQQISERLDAIEQRLAAANL